MTSSLHIARHHNVLVATIHNPPMALMDSKLMAELQALATRADRDPAIGGVVLTGGHPSRFLAHFDVAEILAAAKKAPTLSPRALRAGLRTIELLTRIPGAATMLQRGPAAGLVAQHRFTAALSAIESCSAVWVAALNGDTGGGGCELSLACDFRFMADGPYAISQPEIFLGFPPGGGGTQRLTRLLGPGRALDICLDGGPIDVHRAHDIGLIDRVVAPGHLIETAIDQAARLGRRPKTAIGAVKRAVRHGGSLPLAHGLRYEAAEFMAALTTPQSMAAQQAYLDCIDGLGDVPISDPDTIARTLAAGRFT
jgi:enoyl-CoA hydratase/carnithine racemase